MFSEKDHKRLILVVGFSLGLFLISGGGGGPGSGPEGNAAFPLSLPLPLLGRPAPIISSRSIVRE